MPRKKQSAESINRQLMNTIRNKERGGDKYARNYSKQKAKKGGLLYGSVPENSVGQRHKSRTLLKKDIKKQSRAARKVSKVK